MNADWAKGRNERTGMEGIFPRSYVSVVDEKNSMAPHMPPPPPLQSGYGNMPLEVSQSSSGPQKPSKLNENGKKFGKKMGNAGKAPRVIVWLLTVGYFTDEPQQFLARGRLSDRTLSMAYFKVKALSLRLAISISCRRRQER